MPTAPRPRRPLPEDVLAAFRLAHATGDADAARRRLHSIAASGDADIELAPALRRAVELGRGPIEGDLLDRLSRAHGASKVDWIVIVQAGYLCTSGPGAGDLGSLERQLEGVFVHVGRIVHSDPAIRHALVSDYDELLDRLSRSVADGDPGLAEDCAQEARVRLIQWIEARRRAFAAGEVAVLPAPESEPTLPLSSYVALMARRHMVHHAQAIAAEAGSPDARARGHDAGSASHDPLLVLAARESLARAHLRTPRERLTAREWEVLLHKPIGLSERLIAALLRVNVNTVTQAWADTAPKLEPKGDHRDAFLA